MDQDTLVNTAGSGMTSDKHYRVVRYFSEFSVGVMDEVIADDVDLQEARRIALENADEFGVDVVIQDKDKQGLEAEVESYSAQQGSH